MSTPRKHHFLPQFYLEGFKIPEQKGKYSHIWQFEKTLNSKPVNAAIKDAGCRRDFHTLDHSDLKKDYNSVETILSKIETEQSNLVEEISSLNEVPDRMKVNLSEFISTMRYRVPAYAQHIEASLKSIVQDSFKIMFNSGHSQEPPKALQQYIDKNGIDSSFIAEISNWKIIQHMLENAFAPENISILSQMKFQLVIAPDNQLFITSDSPVALYHPNYTSIKPYGVGLSFKEIEISFPLTARLLIRCGWGNDEGTLNATKKEVIEYNRRSIIMSNNYTYSSYSDDRLLEQIEEFCCVTAGFKFDSLFYGDGSANIQRFIPVTN
ncbi:MAG: DUF4238 domain-containing protein [Thermodesulfobacteriota bacterium]